MRRLDATDQDGGMTLIRAAFPGFRRGQMNPKQELLARLREISSVQLGVPQAEVTEDSTWARLGADSLDRLAMSRAVEDEFRVDIPHAVGERLNTVGETVDHLLTQGRRILIDICRQGVSR
jgi:acyl carrier protein